MKDNMRCATQVNLLPTKARLGFTLAEVLITLGIIGVVAAMTLPNLIANYKAHRLSSQFLESYSSFNRFSNQWKQMKFHCLHAIMVWDSITKLL